MIISSPDISTLLLKKKKHMKGTDEIETPPILL